MVKTLSGSNLNKINSREMAVYALIDIQEQKLYNNLTLKKLFSDNKELLTSQDKAFITELVNGTLRNIVLIDFIINAYSKTKTTSSKMKPLILNILRISVYQIKFMPKIPHSAVCNEAVNFAKKKKFNGLAGFVNGVLRAIIRNVDDLLLILPDSKEKPVEYLSIRYSYSEWIIKRLLEEFGFEEVEKMCEANAVSPRVSICVNIGKISVKELKEVLIKEGMTVSDGEISENALYIGKTKNIAQRESFKRGYYHVMDESSMLAVEVLDGIDREVDKNKNKKIIDLCASPGGKSFYSSYLNNNNNNIEISSRDIHEHKITLMENAIRRLGIKNIELELKDATTCYEEDIETADKILIDAPCSGIGIVKKKPDIKLNKTEADVLELVEIQRKILENSGRYVKKGGTLVYSTCTLFKEENLENINWFCANYGFELEPIKEESMSEYFLNAIKNKLDENSYKKLLENMGIGYLSIYPNLFNTDGFFIANLKKIK
ncbi:MAG: 16S rRNA (cytosine(967)-C(5))-methyltransferase RsmB [bacterium]